MKNIKKFSFIFFIVLFSVFIISCRSAYNRITENSTETAADFIKPQITTNDISSAESTSLQSDTEEYIKPVLNLFEIPPYSETAYVKINGNIPFFTSLELVTDSYEFYSELDSLGRCGECIACIGLDIMPTQPRGQIGQIKPTGWHTVKYNDIINGNYLYMNTEGMVPFENMVADYVNETGNHVMYRVTPVFDGDNLLADGVLIEAKSVDDNGKGILFNVFCYNVQPGIEINYANGDSQLKNTTDILKPTVTEIYEGTTVYEITAVSPFETTTATTVKSEINAYILNINTKKFHYPYCKSVDQMSEKNKVEFTGTRDEAILNGFMPCKICNP